jgi:hypothetical protein
MDQQQGIRETLQCTLEYLIPKDEQSEKTGYHKLIRKSIEEPIVTDDDSNFTTEEIRKVIKSIDYKKARGKDRISNKILLLTFEIFTLTVMSLYNGRLSEGWKRARIIPLIKQGKKTVTTRPNTSQ